MNHDDSKSGTITPKDEDGEDEKVNKHLLMKL